MKKPQGFKGFILMSIGQFISMVGSSMTQFGLSIWIWKTTGNATPFSIITTLFFIPNLIFSPFAGALIDRWPLKKSLILPDLTAGLITLLTLILYLMNKLNLPFLYIASFVSGIFNAFQWPAYSVTISVMLKKEEYGKANGLFSMVENGPMIIAPILAGIFLPLINLSGVMIIDIFTFLFAIIAVLYVYIPKIDRVLSIEKLNIFSEALFGFKYIFKHKHLLSLLTVFLLVNLFEGFINPLYSPLILSKTNNNSIFLGIIQMFFGLGGLIGGFVMTIWGGTKKKIYSLLGGIFLGGISLVFFGISKAVYILSILGLIISFSGVISNASSQAIWQSKISPELQGRVFSARRVIAQLIGTIPMISSGPIVDNILSKYFTYENRFFSYFGSGKGGAMSFMTSLSGILVIFVVIYALSNKLIMNVETID
ncbi:MAG: MFS transporter [Caldisericia bacterium]|jgi:MFS family permease|nr:MFS transporter [Caldisericia bacterium]